MINQISLEDFKAFGRKQTIPLRPITLIYGPNSSGKSTIFNALLMLKQTYEQSLGVETSLLYKGGLTDQQNFSRCVNGRDVNKEFKIGVAHTPDQWRFEMIDSQSLEVIDTPYKQGVFRDPDGKTYLTLDEIDIHQQTKSYRLIDGETILDSIEYSIGDFRFCKLTWIGNKTVQDDGTDILSTPYPCPPPKEDLFFKKYMEKIPDEYLSDNYIGQDCAPAFSTLREEIKFRIEELSTLSEDALECLPYSIDAESISEETLKFIYNFLVQEIEMHNENTKYSFDDFKKDMIYNIEKTVIFTKHGNPYYYGHLDGGILNRPNVGGFSWINKKNNLSKIFDFIAESIINKTPAHKSLFKDINYIGPLRKFPERFTDIAKDSYSSVGNDGERTSAILYENPGILADINSALEKLDLNYELAIHSLKSKDLEAFGDIYSLQVVERSTGIPLTLCDVGFGLSQVLPILVQSILLGSKTVLIEQPEIHLHPKMQTELGDFFIEQYQTREKQFIIETHSEHLLLRIMRRIRETTAGRLKNPNLKLTPKEVSILYVESIDGQSMVREMPLNENGDLIKAWPNGFFEEGLREMF